MEKRIFIVIAIAASVAFMSSISFAMCGMCEGGDPMGIYDQVAKKAMVKDAVKEITYDQFMKIRNSGEGYILLDVLSPESYAAGHIEGAKSFPVNTIAEGSADKMLSKDSKIIVYCGSFQCTASTQAAKKFSGLGYNVLDYKGGLKEWQEKGNQLVK